MLPYCPTQVELEVFSCLDSGAIQRGIEGAADSAVRRIMSGLVDGFKGEMRAAVFTLGERLDTLQVQLNSQPSDGGALQRMRQLESDMQEMYKGLQRQLAVATGRQPTAQASKTEKMDDVDEDTVAVQQAVQQAVRTLLINLSDKATCVKVSCTIVCLSVVAMCNAM